jgi:hypothetical protein
MRSPVASVTPSRVSPFSKAVASVPFAGLAALAGFFQETPALTSPSA